MGRRTRRRGKKRDEIERGSGKKKKKKKRREGDLLKLRCLISRMRKESSGWSAVGEERRSLQKSPRE